jgi:hypothetical protein
MRQDRTFDDCSDGITEAVVAPRALTHDEQKAAEAAFRGEPFNPAWSVAAAKVYAGIQSAMDKRPTVGQADYDMAEDCLIAQ